MNDLTRDDIIEEAHKRTTSGAYRSVTLDWRNDLYLMSQILALLESADDRNEEQKEIIRKAIELKNGYFDKIQRVYTACRTLSRACLPEAILEILNEKEDSNA